MNIFLDMPSFFSNKLVKRERMDVSFIPLLVYTLQLQNALMQVTFVLVLFIGVFG